jgi:hypothetical protein
VPSLGLGNKHNGSLPVDRLSTSLIDELKHLNGGDVLKTVDGRIGAVVNRTRHLIRRTNDDVFEMRTTSRGSLKQEKVLSKRKS